jgi:hypothetical protein
MKFSGGTYSRTSNSLEHGSPSTRERKPEFHQHTKRLVMYEASFYTSECRFSFARTLFYPKTHLLHRQTITDLYGCKRNTDNAFTKEVHSHGGRLSVSNVGDFECMRTSRNLHMGYGTQWSPTGIMGCDWHEAEGQLF